VASIGSVGDTFDNAQAEGLMGLYKTELVGHEGTWRGVENLELAHPELGGALVQREPAAPRHRPRFAGGVRSRPPRRNRGAGRPSTATQLSDGRVVDSAGHVTVDHSSQVPGLIATRAADASFAPDQLEILDSSQPASCSPGTSTSTTSGSSVTRPAAPP
jgi:hypothetical protein